MNVEGWPEALDKALEADTGVKFKTEWNIFSMTYITSKVDSDQGVMTTDNYIFIEGFMAAIKAIQDGEIKVTK